MADLELKSKPDQPNNKRIKSVHEVSVFHMTSYDLEAADEIRKYVHSYYFCSRSNTNADMLTACYEALEQFFVIFKYACQKEQRKTVENDLKEFATNLQNLHNQFTNRRLLIPAQQYAELRQKLADLIDDVYRVKQNAGLGIPKERLVDDEQKIHDAVIE